MQRTELSRGRNGSIKLLPLQTISLSLNAQTRPRIIVRIGERNEQLHENAGDDERSLRVQQVPNDGNKAAMRNPQISSSYLSMRKGCEPVPKWPYRTAGRLVNGSYDLLLYITQVSCKNRRNIFAAILDSLWLEASLPRNLHHPAISAHACAHDARRREQEPSILNQYHSTNPPPPLPPLYDYAARWQLANQAAIQPS